ncbi:hypothetical protein [Pontibacter sp. HSC-14F20]|uniref:hypothetical protein n=1 Tax=Pontibacter sp. HSC-14F20 TaxID=2864136 RepID=UPI0021069776|nr:hypothetical protein [Pontibacter sp. HSC-14F20]
MARLLPDMLPDQVGQGDRFAVIATPAESLGAAGQHPIEGHGVFDCLLAACMPDAALQLAGCITDQGAVDPDQQVLLPLTR